MRALCVPCLSSASCACLTRLLRCFLRHHILLEVDLFTPLHYRLSRFTDCLDLLDLRPYLSVAKVYRLLRSTGHPSLPAVQVYRPARPCLSFIEIYWPFRSTGHRFTGYRGLPAVEVYRPASCLLGVKVYRSSRFTGCRSLPASGPAYRL